MSGADEKDTQKPKEKEGSGGSASGWGSDQVQRPKTGGWGSQK